MGVRLDPRRHPYRPDVAAESLKGRVAARRFVPGVPRRVVVGLSPVHDAASAEATRISELLFGEPFTVYETAAGWAWGQSELDGYVGYVQSDALGAPGPEPTHLVAAVSTHVYPAPDLKRPPSRWLALGSRLALGEREGGYRRLATGGWVPERHVAPLAAREPDILATAARFLGAPYLWGGRTVMGLDCSGLVQIAVQRAGLYCPRDSDMMEHEVGAALPRESDLAELGPGDLAFMKGHIAFFTGAGTLLHANAHAMAVACEPVDDFLARIPGGRRAITTLRRVRPPA